MTLPPISGEVGGLDFVPKSGLVGKLLLSDLLPDLSLLGLSLLGLLLEDPGILYLVIDSKLG